MLLLALAFGAASAAPLHGCSFYKPRLKQASWPGGLHTGCAQFDVQPSSCQKTKVIPPGIVINYQGDRVSGRLPAYFIEVTPHRGYSIFTQDPDGAVLREQLQQAVRFYENKIGDVTGVIPGADQGYVDGQAGRTTGFLYARTLKVPYAGFAWGFLSIQVASGSAFPTCFDGISEFSPHTWADLPSQPEAEMTAVQAPFAEVLCNQLYSGVLLPEVLPAVLSSPFEAPRNVCAVGVGPDTVRAFVLKPTSEAMEAITNPRKVCMGRLGPHLPRTGWVHAASDWDAANTVAYRMATLAEDHFLSGPGIEPGDRWQLVWPPAISPRAHACFRPGSVRPEEILTNGPVEMPSLPMTDGALRPRGAMGAYSEGGSSYVFAVWRRFEKCVEPGQGALFQLDLAAVQVAREAACAPINAADNMP